MLREAARERGSERDRRECAERTPYASALEFGPTRAAQAILMVSAATAMP
ncbi:MAG: hypothetical protein OEQ18_11225 [Gammaproteobacteria bacterium]|nr:hypothetical protein [Gammaproteobacteria bacterium]